MVFMNLYTGTIGRGVFALGYLGFFVLAAGMAYFVTNVSSTFSIVAFIFGLVAMPLVFSIFIRRLHDLSQTGWLALLIFVPYINIVLIIVLSLWPGSKSTRIA